MIIKPFPKNDGATLALVLVFLLILTVLGVASMSDSIIQQKSSTNIYLENEAFHTADSAVSAAIHWDEIAGNALYGTDTSETKVGQDYCVGNNGELTEIEDGENCAVAFEDHANVIAYARVEYLGCGTCPNFEMGVSPSIGCNAWKITGDSTVAEKTNAAVQSWVTKVGGCFSSGKGSELIL
ncbi:pilus assembly PilX family protein [Kangiella shandongensis]|uniref:pilus assembly PilX family protein n=1 Tax=Kangiella shandongensis TaxID=2763258 RepID=UPI001CBD655C|nr:PilX N-terminal domain-containing pilus assembly protein [Kangiella shandongensis]